MKQRFTISKIILVLMFASEVSAEEMDAQPVVESDSTAEITEHNIPCIRCDKRNQLDIQVLGIVNTPIGVSGVSLTRHLLDRTSVQGGIGYGFGGVNVSGSVLHYLEKDQSLYILTGLSLTSGKTKERKENKEKRQDRSGRNTCRSKHHDDECYSRDDKNNSNWNATELEGLWVNVGFGADIFTQSGLSYGLDFGLGMAILSDVLSSKIKLCFGAIAADSCQEPWRFMPYLTLLKLGYSW